ncbi:hypothetical protein C8R47DRAFT_681854 [Mycena vitilis]|nr:hypothetical protein C8R47DRAFT_14866 [Mycena vitilis]KAJ6512120.1 hypothetical protein C8R47DRAFT_681854 [Mycena vitilis]
MSARRVFETAIVSRIHYSVVAEFLAFLAHNEIKEDTMSTDGSESSDSVDSDDLYTLFAPRVLSPEQDTGDRAALSHQHPPAIGRCGANTPKQVRSISPFPFSFSRCCSESTPRPRPAMCTRAPAHRALCTDSQNPICVVRNSRAGQCLRGASSSAVPCSPLAARRNVCPPSRALGVMTGRTAPVRAAQRANAEGQIRQTGKEGRVE